MNREGFNDIKIHGVSVEQYDGTDTLYFICTDSKDERFLNNVLRFNKFEILKKELESGGKKISLFFPMPNFVIPLNENYPIEEIRGYMQILNNQVKFVNTLYQDSDGTPHLNFQDKIDYLNQ